MILITKTDSSGHVRHCDEKCYNAHEPECDCVCGGINHGIGLARAIANVEIMRQSIPANELEETESVRSAYNTQMSFLKEIKGR